MASQHDKDSVASLTARLAEEGHPYPDMAARSELEENIAQIARFRLLRGLWQEVILPRLDPSLVSGLAGSRGPVRRMLQCGVDEADLARFAAHVALFSLLAMVHRIDEGSIDSLAPGPGWRLVEVAEDGDRLTGRDLDGLHEQILSLDPRGLWGRDLLELVDPAE